MVDDLLSLGVVFPPLLLDLVQHGVNLLRDKFRVIEIKAHSFGIVDWSSYQLGHVVMLPLRHVIFELDLWNVKRWGGYLSQLTISQFPLLRIASLIRLDPLAFFTTRNLYYVVSPLIFILELDLNLRQLGRIPSLNSDYNPPQFMKFIKTRNVG